MARATHAGGVVFRRGDSGPLYLLVESSGSKARWVFPKGHLEKKESAEEAALREVAEEAAVEARAVHELGRARLEKGGQRIEVEFFLMEYVRQAEPLESRAVRWCAFEAALEALDDAKAIRVLRRAHELVSAALPEPRPLEAAARAALRSGATTGAGLLALLPTVPLFARELVDALGAGPTAVLALALAYPLGSLLVRFMPALLAPLVRRRSSARGGRARRRGRR
jgi:8-oxo-dGTP pyrophosphatase MutT (NUDIX family)